MMIEISKEKDNRFTIVETRGMKTTNRASGNI